MNATDCGVFTVGHSNHSRPVFLALLRTHKVEVIADVRSTPYSRHLPEFNRRNLEPALRAAGIGYVFLGRELGGRPEDPACYDAGGRVQYRLLAGTPSFQQGLERVRRGLAKYRICLMCTEREPLDCHRSLLVAEELVKCGVPVAHILSGGAVESHENAIARLLAAPNGFQGSLFDFADSPALSNSDEHRSSLTAQAIQRQAERVAFVDESLAVKQGDGPSQ